MSTGLRSIFDASVNKGPSLSIDLEVVSRFVISFLFPNLPLVINFIRR